MPNGRLVVATAVVAGQLQPVPTPEAPRAVGWLVHLLVLSLPPGLRHQKQIGGTHGWTDGPINRKER